MLHEREDDMLEFALVHLAVADADADLRHELFQPFPDAIDAV
ncbi:MAG: hypothetical protein R2849_13115 [Thermomicrobiales bacterium]